MDDTNGMEGQGWLQLLQSLPPEQLQQWLALSQASEKGSALEKQMQQAEALRNRPGETYKTPIGGALGAAGELLGAVGSLRKEKAAEGKLDALQQQTLKSRADVLGTLGRLQQAQLPRAQAPASPQQPPPMGPLPPQPPSPFGFGGY